MDIISFEITGFEIKKMLKIIQTPSSYYASAGIKQVIYLDKKMNKNKVFIKV